MNIKRLLCITTFLRLSNAWLFGKFGMKTVSGTAFPSTTSDKLRYFIDIDGTICDTNSSDYTNSKPNHLKIYVFNELYNRGHEVHYWSARGAVSGKNWEQFTVQQLESWNVKYTSINLGKPHYDVWIDDKCINVNNI